MWVYENYSTATKKNRCSKWNNDVATTHFPEYGSKYTIITHDLSIGKVAKQIQYEGYPYFDSIFVMFVGFNCSKMFFQELERL